MCLTNTLSRAVSTSMELENDPPDRRWLGAKRPAAAGVGDEALDDVAGEPWAKKLCVALSPRPEMSSSCIIFQPLSFTAGDVSWTMNAGAAGYRAPLDDSGADGYGTTADGV